MVRVWSVIILTVLLVTGGRREAKGLSNLENEYSSLFCTPGSGADLSVSNQGGDIPLQLKVTKKFAGAISSLLVNGVETVNSYDHGYEIQYDLRPPELGECFNPTEAGNFLDKETSSSLYLQSCKNSNKLYTKNKMAYYVPSEYSHLGTCPDRSDPTKFGQGLVSDYELSKIVETNALGMPNVIRINAKFYIPEQRPLMVVEAPTQYFTPDYTSFTFYDPVLKKQGNFLSEAHNSGGYIYSTASLDIPIISNGTYSIATYAPDVSWYGTYKFISPHQDRRPMADTTKMSAIYNLRNSQVGDFYYETFIVVSKPDRIIEDLKELLIKRPPVNLVPKGHVDAVAVNGVVRGWAADADGSPVRVDFYLDGKTVKEGGIPIGSTEANLVRSDVKNAYPHLNMNTGYEFRIPSNYISDGKEHTIYVWARDINEKSEKINTVLAGSGMKFNLVRGDANGDGKVNFSDFGTWKKEFVGLLTTKITDFDGDGKVDLSDFEIWKRAYLGI